MQQNVLLALPLVTLGLLGALPAPAGQDSLHLSIGDPARKDKSVELRLDGITDAASGELITPEVLAQSLANTGLLFVGESHTNLDFHNVQLRIIQALHDAGRDVLIGLEMFPYTQQAVLTDWIAGKYSEEEFVEASDWYKYWGYHWRYYRDIFVYAQANGIPMFGVNTPREVVTAVRKKGFQDLSPEEAANFPHPVKPATADQRVMYKSFFDADDALHMTDQAVDGMLRAQTVWDFTMGWNALQALIDSDADDPIMVVLIGSGHVTYGLGAERQTAPYYEGQISSVIPVEVIDDDEVPVERVQASYANFVWGLPKMTAEIYPRLEVSLMGPIGDQPTQIIQVSENSVGERAGLLVGDVLVNIDGTPVGSSENLRKISADWRWGDVVTVDIERDGEPLQMNVPLRRALSDADNQAEAAAAESEL